MSKIIRESRISQANLRLARLLQSDVEPPFARTVITPNFDDHQLRALRLFGADPLAFDHPVMATRLELDPNEVQVVHVHGSYRFYDLANLKQEIAERVSSQSGPQISMLEHLSAQFHEHTVLVVGYSGWDGDVVTSALMRRRASAPKHNVYWCCFRSSDRSSVPAFLRDDETVYFVLPDEQTGRGVSEPGGPPRGSVPVQADTAEREKPEQTLAAITVFSEILQGLGVPAPALVADPIEHFASLLRRDLPREAEIEADPYQLHAIPEVVGEIAKRERTRRRRSERFRPSSGSLRQVRELVASSKYSEAISLVSGLEFSNWSRLDIIGILDPLFVSAFEVPGASERLVGFSQFLRVADAASPPETTRLRERIAEALLQRGLANWTLRKYEAEVADYDELVRRFGEASEPSLREQVATALNFKAITLRTLDQAAESIAAYEEVVSRFGGASESSLREQVARALVGKGLRLGALGRSEEEITTYDELVRRFSDAPEPALREQVATALNFKAITLATLDRSEEAVATYEEVVRRFGDTAEPALRDQVARALVGKGLRLRALGAHEESIAAYNEVLRRFGTAAEPALREQVASALNFRGMPLSALNRAEEEIATYDEVVRRFGEATEPALRAQVATALNFKAITLATLDRVEEAVANYNEVVRRFGEAAEPILRDQVGRAIIGKGLLARYRGELDEARLLNDEVIRRLADVQETRGRRIRGEAHFGNARIHAAHGDFSVALKSLESALTDGYPTQEMIESAGEFDTLRESPEDASHLRDLLARFFPR